MTYERMSVPASGPASYNLFRRRCASDLYCAVAQAHPVPDFIDGQDWEFAGTTRGERGAPAGFRLDDARAGVQMNGFYLFLAHARRPAGAAPVRHAA